MDPSAALRMADQNISDQHFDDAADQLFDYYQWRLAGGFQPAHDACTWYSRRTRFERGDAIAADLVTRLQNARD
jgi:hypothetical protein